MRTSPYTPTKVRMIYHFVHERPPVSRGQYAILSSALAHSKRTIKHRVPTFASHPRRYGILVLHLTTGKWSAQVLQSIRFQVRLAIFI